MEESKKQWQHIQEDEEDNAKWVTHYSSDHQILLVGEGDFSFSLSLAKSFGSAANIVASSLNSYDNVTKMYKKAKSNLEELHKLGAFLLHGVDATKMKLHPDLKMRRFDRVIFNFPHAGFHGSEDSSSLIKMHKALVHGFFNNASRMLRANGEIHISHKTTKPFSYWNIENLAVQCFLALVECADFNRKDYPGYNNKRGDGYRCDEPFPLGKCCTYKFVYISKGKRKRMKRKRMRASRHKRNLPIEEIKYAVEQLPTSAQLNYCPTKSHFLKMKEETPFTGVHSSNMTKVHGRGGYSSLGMSLGPPRTFQPSANVRYSMTDHIRRTEPEPTSAYNRYSLTDNIRTKETVPEPLYTRRTLQPIEERQSLQTWPASANLTYSLSDNIRRYARRTRQPMEPLQSLQPGPKSANITYSRTMESVYSRRTVQPMQKLQSLVRGPTSSDVKSSLTDDDRTKEAIGVSADSRNDRQKDDCRRRNESGSCLDGVRSEFERFIAEVPGRSVQSELHRLNIFMSERSVTVQS